MKIDILTMFPELFGDFSRESAVRRAVSAGSLSLAVTDIRDFTEGSFRKIDDSPYGGGPGMIIRCQPVVDAIRAVTGETGDGSLSRSVTENRPLSPPVSGYTLPPDCAKIFPGDPP